MTQSPAGWYPDPAPPPPGGPPLLRYWDGYAWTAHVQPAWYVGASAYAGFPEATAAPVHATTADGQPLAGWWQRVGAYVIDSLIVGAVASTVTLPVQLATMSEMNAVLERGMRGLEGGGGVDVDSLLNDYLDAAGPVLMWSGLSVFAVWSLYSGVMLRMQNATVGKMALGLAVRRKEAPGQLPWGAIARRLLVQQGVSLTVFVPALYFALFWFPWLDCLWATWDRKRQTLHDKVAGTQVVRTR